VTHAVLAWNVVHDGPLTELDRDVAGWVARETPAWAEWVARLFSWIGGMVGLAVVAAGGAAFLLHRGERTAAVLLVVVTAGVQLLVVAAKNGYERPRPDVGSPIDLPTSFSFPSGHATNGIAVFGLVGLLAASYARTERGRTAAIVAGFTVGVLTGASRVVLNVHYVTDVLAGVCFGLAWLAACLLALRAIERRRAGPA
jgi:undecaprenyl-diphosphatase